MLKDKEIIKKIKENNMIIKYIIVINILLIICLIICFVERK